MNTLPWTAIHIENQSTPTNSWGVTWLVNAPGAHMLWDQYVIILINLTEELSPDMPPPNIYLNGATHEIQVWALNHTTVGVSTSVVMEDIALRMLTPMNHGYQFIAKDDFGAFQRLQQLIDRMLKQEFSPDTDYREFWDRELFPDGATLRREIQLPVFEREDGWYHRGIEEADKIVGPFSDQSTAYNQYFTAIG